MTLQKLIQEMPQRFDEKANRLFTRGGLSVLLDYPPHDIVLDEESVKSFITTYQEELLAAVVEEAKAERQFILNVLDGIDEADQQMGNKSGGTKALRFALQNRALPFDDLKNTLLQAKSSGV